VVIAIWNRHLHSQDLDGGRFSGAHLSDWLTAGLALTLQQLQGLLAVFVSKTQHFVV